MKNITDFINEAAKIRPIKTTVGEYLAWYFGVDHVDEIDPVDDFQSTDFDPESLEKHFKGSYTAQFEFLYDHRDEKITLNQEETPYDILGTFNVGKIEFCCAQMEEFTGR